MSKTKKLLSSWRFCSREARGDKQISEGKTVERDVGEIKGGSGRRTRAVGQAPEKVSFPQMPRPRGQPCEGRPDGGPIM